MTIAERIYERVQGLSEVTQHSVLDFVEFLAHKEQVESSEWSTLSLLLALRDMEDEEWPEYTPQPFDEG